MGTKSWLVVKFVVATANDDDGEFTPTDGDTRVVSVDLVISELLSRFVVTVWDNSVKLVVDGASLFTDDDAALELFRSETADTEAEDKPLVVDEYDKDTAMDDGICVADVTMTPNDAADGEVDCIDAETAFDGRTVAAGAEIWLL